MIIRPYRPGDAPGMKAVHNASVRSLAKDYLPAQLEAWSPMDSAIADWEGSIEGNIVYVAVEGDVIIGFGDITPDCYLYRLYVAPGNSRKGIGSKLLSALEREARASGMVEIILDSSLSAVGFYKRHGYKEVQKNRIMIGDAVLDAVRMEKKLD